MSKRVKGPDGITRIVPDDATDAEIAALLEPQPSRANEPKMSAAAAGTALPDTADARYEANWGEKPLMNEAARQTMTDPLVRPTGIDAVDSLSSPLNLIMAGTGIVKPAARMAFKGLASLISSVDPEVAEHVIGMIGGYRAKQGLKMAQALKAAAKEAPAVAESTTAPRTMPSAQPTPDVAAPTAAAPAARLLNPNDAMRTAREAFTAAGQKPLPAEVANTSALIMRGKAPEEAVRIVMGNRPPVKVDPAAAFAARFGTPSTEEVARRVVTRNATGRWE